MIRALAFVAGAGALAWWWLAQQQPASVPSDPQYFIPDTGEDPHPMTQPTISPQQAAIVQLAVQLAGDQDPALVLGVIEHESNFNPSAYNGNDPDGGAFGLMQIRAPAAQQVGFKGDMRQLFDPALNIATGVAYLDWIAGYLARHGATGETLMVAAYNEGVGNALAGLPNYPYVSAVMANRAKWRAYLSGVPVA